MEKELDNVKLITDGGCRENPGKGAIGLIILDEKDQELARVSKCIGHTTNNRAEYLALIEGLDYAAKFTRGTVRCFLDSELVVKQVREECKIKHDELRKLFYKVLDKESIFKEVTYTHLSRTNLMIKKVDKIVNHALDK